ncbi:exodeoxyribonuclease VII large subunit (plasmid) [Pseudomonas sp. FeN3W]|nr:exodeoxyribonuclease VII large subunit [Pseudomonas sp. FeN3W]
MSNEYLRLSEVLGYVKQAVSILGEKPFWIAAEVLQISGASHRYLELVEYDADRREVAKTRGMIWRDEASILDAFKRATGMALAPGMKVLILARPTFHEIYGLSLNIVDIDPKYTLGDMEAKIKVIEQYLKSKGWFDLNKIKKAPEDFTRVAVIAPKDAAGLGDFRVEADKLDKHGLCKFSYYHATFQGNTAANSIVDQMVLAHADHQITAFDCLIIIRGGGDKAGLYHLNDRRLAASVCRFPVPVLVGIGHERDKVFIEEIACLRFSTPSLLISHILQRIVQNSRDAEINIQRINKLAGFRLDSIDKNVSELYFSLREKGLSKLSFIESQALQQKSKLISQASSVLDRQQNDIDRVQESMLQHANSVLNKAELQSQSLISAVMSANPLAILDKGYGYVSIKGRIVTQATDLEIGSCVEVTLKNSSFTSIVENINVK